MPCELCERPADAHLCDPCVRDLAERLEQLPALLDQLADMLVPTQPVDGGRRAAAVVARPPADLDIIVRRYGFAVLPAWHCALLDGTGGHRGAGYGALDEQVTGACIALRASITWIAAWPGASDLACEVRDLWDDTRTVVGAADLPARMGPCPQVVAGGGRCGAELLLPQGQQVLRCGWCGSTYPPGVWAALKVAQRGISPAALAGGPEVRLSRA